MPRFSVALLGFSTGISHMRRRRLLTALTLISVTFVTMGTSMFTTMLTISAFRVPRLAWPASYDGILVRHWEYSSGGFGAGQAPQVGMRLLDELKTRYGDKATIAPRAWTWISDLTRGLHVTDSKGNVVPTPIIAILGLSPQEQEVTRPQNSLIHGVWFIEEMADKRVAIISKDLADAGNLNVGDIMWVSGYSFRIVGIVDDKKFIQIYDLDNLWITPWDQRLPGFEGRVLPGETIIIPYETLLDTFKGWVVSIAMKFKPEYVKDGTIFNVGRDIFRETGIPLFLGANKVGYSIKRESFITVFGWQHQIIPLVLAGLIILSLLTSSIEQRRRELYTLSTVGLSPFHVAFLFLSESVTYSVLGGIIGYTLGILTTMIMGLTPWGKGLQVNYASTTVVMTISTLMAAIIAITIYPIYQASKLVTPSLERRWKLPKPKGDQWEVALPFTLAEDIKADGFLAFVHELLVGHLVEDSEIFRTRPPIQYIEEEKEGKIIRSLEFDSALTPYELGITQAVKILNVKDVRSGRHLFSVRLERKSGPAGSWMTFGREFMDVIRKQTILWGSIKPEERDDYQRRFAAISKEMKRRGAA